MIMEGHRSGRIPAAVNLGLAGFHAAVNFFQFIALPLWLLPASSAWAWTLLPLALLANPFWSLIHEAIHDLLHPSRKVNAFFGRLLAMLFGAPFRVLRVSHLLHHKLNRLPLEGAEYYDQTKKSKAGAAPAYYFQILIGLYLLEVLSALYFWLPRDWLARLKARFVADGSLSAISLQNWLSRESLREIRRDGAIVIAWLALSFYCYGPNWPLLLAALLARGFLISFLDNVYHYETAVGDIFYARNLRLAAPLSKLLLNFNLHGIHHANPAIPWIHLPKAFAAGKSRYQGGYFAASVRQLRGPVALQELPRAAATELSRAKPVS
jgi:fatty acid desaturase